MLSVTSRTLGNKLNCLDLASAIKVAARRAQFMERLKKGDVTRKEVLDAADWIGRPVNFFSNTRFKAGPIALTTTLTTNILNPGTTTGGVNATSAPFDKLYIILQHMRVVNKTGSAATVSLWMGATGANAAGTEFIWLATSIAANYYDQWYGNYRMGQADFLVGGSGTATALSITLMGEVGIGA